MFSRFGYKMFIDVNTLMIIHFLYLLLVFFPILNAYMAIEVRTFVPTRFLTGPDIRAHIKWAPPTFVLTSNDHPGHSRSHQMTTPDIHAHIKWPPRTSCSRRMTTPDIGTRSERPNSRKAHFIGVPESRAWTNVRTLESSRTMIEIRTRTNKNNLNSP